MGEIRAIEVNAVGRIVEPGVITLGQLTHFKLDVGLEKPIHCVCQGKTAENAQQYLGAGDEISPEGCMRWVNFKNDGLTLVFYARFISYGRKTRSFQPLSRRE
jgi:hypothetical protein